MSEKIAEVKLSCGRLHLSVRGICVAMEGDACRQNLPEDVMTPIPQEELESSFIGDKRASELPKMLVQFFRGDRWSSDSLEWAAAVINGEREWKK